MKSKSCLSLFHSAIVQIIQALNSVARREQRNDLQQS